MEQVDHALAVHRSSTKPANFYSKPESLLEYHQGAWDEPVDVCRWTAEHLRERDALAALLKQNARPHWDFKDPRTLLTFDFWLPVSDFPHFIGTFPHPPLRVALSLQQRNRFSLDKGFALWLAYNQRLLKKSRHYGFPLVDFDLDGDSYLADVLPKICVLGLSAERFPQAKNFFAAHLPIYATKPALMQARSRCRGTFRRFIGNSPLVRAARPT